MRKFAAAVDRFFYQLIEDEPSRAFFLHLPFWGLAAWLAWYVMLHSGLWLLWVTLVFIVMPIVLSTASMDIYKSSQDEPTYLNGKITMFRAWCAAYVCLVLAMIGIPGHYLGLILQVVQSNVFARAYWWGIEAWWKLFHVYQTAYNTKDLQAFLKFYEFEFATWQWCFLVSSVVLAPAWFAWLYTEERTARLVRESEAEVAAIKAKDDLAQAERDKAKAEERRIELKKKQLAKLEAEAEARRKLDAKINEVKGKDPWDSGFL